MIFKFLKNKTKKMFAVILLICVSFSSVSVFADEKNDDITNILIDKQTNFNEYLAYQENYSNYNLASNCIVLSGGSADIKGLADTVNSDVYKGYSNTLAWNQSGNIEYTFDVKEEALYNIYLTYLPLKGNGNNLNFGLMLDGKFPFSDSESLVLPRCYKDSDTNRYDTFGNQYPPEQIEIDEFLTRALYDDTGASVLPYYFYFSAGTHTITFTKGTEPFIIAEIFIGIKDNFDDYIDTSSSKVSSSNAETIIIEGESASIKDSRSIVPKSDTTSVSVHPSDCTKQVLNYIGSTNWKTPGEEVTWEFNVKESAYYDLRVLYKQDQTINSYSYRILKIDGQIPFKQALSLKFYYGTSWQTFDFSDGNKPYWIWLDAGKHTISLTATLGETADSYNKLKSISEKLSDLYLDIAMITGESPDSNRDYDLFKQIQNFNERLNTYNKQLLQLSSDMKAASDNNNTSFISAINNMARILKSMEENPYTAQNYVSDYYSNYTTVSSWLYDMKSMPLSIDRIYLIPINSDYEIDAPNFIENMIFSIERFLSSFAADYSNASKDNSNIKIWVNWGRDQAMVLSSLIHETFTPKTGIDVNLELTDATLVKGILSNNAPDLALHLSRTEPVNLAMRGALYDLTQFKDYDDVVTRFGESASIPYEYGDGVYALPDTQSFYLMFYRKDIFNKLGLSVPKTWDEFLSVTAVLQRNNMQAWIPYTQITSATTVNTGVGGLNLFATILQQFGGNLYNQSKTASLLDSTDSLMAFTYWTDMYTKYKIPTTASFYNRFRLGTIPLGIEVYTQYTTLDQAAPEISGKWGIALVPGCKDKSGTVNNTVAGSGTGCSILASSKNKDAAWEFLKWWTSAETQLKYNNNVESILGTVSRTTTSNLSAFEQMAWNPNDLQILIEQRSKIQEIPEVPGSYYVSRSVDQAFWNVVNNASSPKDSLVKWTEISNNEIERKITRYKQVNNDDK